MWDDIVPTDFTDYSAVDASMIGTAVDPSIAPIDPGSWSPVGVATQLQTAIPGTNWGAVIGQVLPAITGAASQIYTQQQTTRRAELQQASIYQRAPLVPTSSAGSIPFLASGPGGRTIFGIPQNMFLIGAALAVLALRR